MIKICNKSLWGEFTDIGLRFKNDFDKLYDISILDNPCNKILLYEFNNKIIGFLQFNKILDDCEIVNLFIDVNYRNNGFAKELITFALKDFHGFVYLDVNVNNLCAINLYKKCGFYIFDKREKYYNDEDALIMRRECL